MIGYFDAILGDGGQPILASITVYVANTSTKPTIYSDIEGDTEKDNPFQTDSLGRFQFFAPNGRYDIEVSGTGITTYKLEDVLLRGPFINASEFGVVGDDSTDNTSVLQAAATAAQGGTLMLPAGTIRFDNLTVEKDTDIVGVAAAELTSLGTVLKCMASSGSAIALSGTATESRKRIRFRNFMLYGNSDLDVGFDIQGTDSINPSIITLDSIEIRNMAKTTSKAIYLKDASMILLNNVRARYGTIAGYALYLDSQYFNGGPCVALNSEFGQTNESLAGLYHTATGNHFQCFSFISCYFGAGSSSVNGYPVWLAGGTPENFRFDACALESKNETANASCLRIATNTKNLALHNSSFSGFDVVDFGIRFESGAHNSLSIKSPRFLAVQTTCVKAESGVTFTDSEIMGASRDNSATGWDGTFTGCLRQGFGQSKYLLGSELVYKSPSTFTSLDTTPSIAGGNFFKTNNGGSTSITFFDDGITGQRVVILFGDAVTTLVHNVSYIYLQGATNWTPAAGDTIELIQESSIWYELSRSDNTA